MLNDPRSRRQYRQVADQIMLLVAGQGLGPGQRLPSERDLAERLGVSRPSLREALIALEVEGQVEIRMGSGIYLLRPGHEGAAGVLHADAESPMELLEARCIIESTIAEQVAVLVTPDLIAALDDNLQQMAAAMDRTPLAIRIDAGFHDLIASGLGNSLLSGLVAQIFQKRLTPIFARYSAHFEGPRTWREALAEHRLIRDALAARDPAAAGAAMRHHLTQSQRRFNENVLGEQAEHAILQDD
ncbi:FadR/GntR family transcriptional regulator [Paracoccus mangrovi]|uniref:FadR/GntR family transcriptional regulator n=1 Tax=Paracoccus mangrovi TaxID=1715645 RepID=A0ABV7R2M3_9RHOB